MQAHSLSLKLASDPEKLKRLTGARFGYVGDRPLDDGSPVSDNIYTGPGLYGLGAMASPSAHFVDPSPRADTLDRDRWFKVSRHEHNRTGRGTYLLPEPVLDALLVCKVE